MGTARLDQKVVVMIVGEGTATVQATPNEVFEFVLDLNRYRQADHKIGRVKSVERDGNSGTAQFAGRLRGLPGPTGTYPFTLTDTHLQFDSPTAGAARWFLDFEGTFDCEAGDDGTVVTHREVFMFKRPWSWLAEPLLRNWLERDTADEMDRLKAIIEQDG
jgi:hypothetical protein